MWTMARAVDGYVAAAVALCPAVVASMGRIWPRGAEPTNSQDAATLGTSTCSVPGPTGTKNSKLSDEFGVWRSPVAHLLWERWG